MSAAVSNARTKQEVGIVVSGWPHDRWTAAGMPDPAEIHARLSSGREVATGSGMLRLAPGTPFFVTYRNPTETDE